MPNRPYEEVVVVPQDPELAEFRRAAEVHFRKAYEESFGLGDKLAARRRELELSQSQLAERAGVPQADVSRIERGKGNPTLTTLRKILQALHLQLDIVPTAN